MSIEMILQIGKIHVGGRPIVKKREKHFLFVRTRRRPFRRRLFQVKDIFLAVRQPQQMAFVFLLDGHVPFHGQVHQRRGDVAHRGFVIHQRATFAGSQLIRGIVLHRNRLARRIAPARPPQPEHHEKRNHRNE